jgi:hypothetical protein
MPSLDARFQGHQSHLVKLDHGLATVECTPQNLHIRLQFQDLHQRRLYPYCCQGRIPYCQALGQRSNLLGRYASSNKPRKPLDSMCKLSYQ